MNPDQDIINSKLYDAVMDDTDNISKIEHYLNEGANPNHIIGLLHIIVGRMQYEYGSFDKKIKMLIDYQIDVNAVRLKYHCSVRLDSYDSF